MPSRSIRWSSTSKDCWKGSLNSRDCLLSVIVAASLASPLWAMDDSPNIDLEIDPFAAEFSRAFEERLLVKEAPYALDEGDYVPIIAGGDPLPPSLEIPPQALVLPTPTIIAPAKPAALTNGPPEWVLFQPQEKPLETEWLLHQVAVNKVVAEEQVLQRIALDYAPREVQPETMDLLAWPQDEGPREAPFEIFDAELISPFAPIPELNELPFPDA